MLNVNIMDTEVNLIRGSEGLVWNVFQRITKESSFYSLQEATIPSLRCHPETIALIEKIKTEGLNNAPLLNRLMNDFKVRVISPKDLLKEYEALDKFCNERMMTEVNKSLRVMPAMYGAGSATVYLSSSIIGAIAGSTRKLFGNGIFGTISTRATGLYTGAFVFSVGAVSTLAIYNYFVKENIDFYSKRIESLKKEKKLLSSPTQKPLLIEVEPISTPSIIDERVHVSKFTWAVTLVTNSGTSGNHAEIIVEGINDGFYDQEAPRIGAAQKVGIGEKFIHLADYAPRIQSGLLSPDDLKYETRSEIWMVPSNKVQKMLEAIEKEKYLPADQRRPFNIWGIGSKIYKYSPKWTNPFSCSGKSGDNCFTWARDQLKMIDIDLGEGYMDYITAMAKNYTRNKEEYKTIPIQEMI